MAGSSVRIATLQTATVQGVIGMAGGMVLMAAMFSLRPNTRSGGLLARIGAGVAAGFAVYFFSKVIYALGLSATLPQALAAWTPALFAGLIGLSGLFHLEDG